jgi:hypothetical protein
VAPARLFHRPTADGTEAGVADQLVGAGEDGDGVELEGRDLAEHSLGTAGRRSQQALGPQRQPAGLAHGQRPGPGPARSTDRSAARDHGIGIGGQGASLLLPAYASVPMNVAIVYESLTGNTRKAAHLIAQELVRAGATAVVFPVTRIDFQALEAADLVVVGTWTDGMIIAGQRPGRAQRLRRLPVLDRKRCLVFCTYAIDQGKTLQKLTGIMQQRGANVLGAMAIKRNDLEGGAKEFVARLLEAIPV